MNGAAARVPIDLSEYARGLELAENGIWFAPMASSVSYPDDGNAVCFQVEDSSYWFRHRNRCIVSLVARYAPSGPIFDVGGGNGVVAAALVRAGRPAVVVEPGPVGARNAASRGVTSVCATFEAADFLPGRLPAVGMFDVLEHIEDDVGFLRRLRGSLVSDGWLYLTVPAYPALWSDEDVHAGHFRRYTSESLGETLSRAGFEVVFSSYLFAVLTLPVAVLRALPSRIRTGNARPRAHPAADHMLPRGPVGRGLTWLLDAEFTRIDEGRAVPFGTSCLVAARARG